MRPTGRVSSGVLVGVVCAMAHRVADPTGADVEVPEESHQRVLRITLLGYIAAVVLIVPLGLLLPVATRTRAWLAVPAGAGFAALIELSQLTFLPHRVATGSS